MEPSKYFQSLRLFDGLRFAVDLKLQVDVVQVGMHGAFGHAQPRRDPAPLHALGGKAQDFNTTWAARFPMRLRAPLFERIASRAAA